MSAVMDQVRHRVTVADFHKMGEAGIFLEDDRVELIDCAVDVDHLFPQPRG